ncbi:class I SAM-dependent methyltransferase [Nevskia sp.]|uniref:class I SAM-dependent methyltransferase n=1 Tax=Nevskia sp. TaxID=1929292 RepID=UPI0025FAC6D5|nr:class I SAM-dependent methyltransferase [Nevskia sp.]
MPDPSRSTSVSPTALYTGAVWARHRLSHPAFATAQGRLMLAAAQPAMRLARALGGPTLDGLLLARHRIIDEELHAAIKAGAVSQVIEIAAGLSPRGWRFAKQYGERIRYIEADLPGMAARKRALLARVGCVDGPHHRVADIDAFALDGPASLAGIAATLNPAQGTAIITEGLINYFPLDAVTGLWTRMVQALGGFPNGLYLSDLHIGGENRKFAVQAFVRLLSAFVRGRVHLHFDAPVDAENTLKSAGFATAALLSPADFADRYRECRDPAAKLVRVIKATTNG